MNQAFWSLERTTGSLLASGLLIGFLALIIMIARGAFPAFSAVLQGSIEQMVPHSATFRLTTLMFAIAWLPQLLGFGLLARLLLRAGESKLSILGFTLILTASIMGLLYSTFRMSLDPWAAQVTAQTGSAPEIYQPLQNWIDSSFRIGYLAHFAGVILFGWGILRSGVLEAWVGQVTIGWSFLWLLGGLAGIGAPAIPLIMPAVIGLILLRG